jgi:hypothetical protein
MNASIRGGSRHLGYLVGFSWLWGDFGGLRFGVRGTTFGVCGGFRRSLVFGDKIICFVYSLGGSLLQGFFLPPTN